MPEGVRSRMQESHSKSLSYEDEIALKAELWNQQPGTMTGYDCAKCKNRGYFNVADGFYIKVRECECMKVRRSLHAIARSGMADLMGRYTLERYKTDEPWQKTIKDGAEVFLQNPDSGFFVGGNSGSGKTHICTAICGELIKRGKSVKYMVWTTDLRALKAVANDKEEYDRRFKALIETDVLYIDDLFKVRSKDDLRGPDIQHTYDVINKRYCTNGKITIISSEMSLQQIIAVDEATGGRIYEMVGDYRFNIAKNPSKNWRLQNG